jgi:hypothetical protein
MSSAALGGDDRDGQGIADHAAPPCHRRAETGGSLGGSSSRDRTGPVLEVSLGVPDARQVLRRLAIASTVMLATPGWSEVLVGWLALHAGCAGELVESGHDSQDGLGGGLLRFGEEVGVDRVLVGSFVGVSLQQE